MLEEHVAYYLEKYIGNYVKGLSKEALKISVWQGNVELTNMQLKPEALNALKLPIKVKAGFLGSVKLKVPWSRLGKEPVVVFLDRIFVLAEPATKVEGGSDDAAIQQAKNNKVKEAEISMVEAMREDLDKAGMNNSWLGSLISTIIGNLRLSITNIHIRYEDTESNSGHPFTAGLTLKKLAAVTVDDHGKETFVTGGALDHIQKAGELEGLAFYFNSDTKPWELDKPWEDFLPTEWSKVFEPGIGTQFSESDSDVLVTHDFQHLLQPVSATARYRRHGAADTKAALKEGQRATLFLDDVILCLSQKQYRDALKLVENFNAFSKRLQYAHYRPACPVKDDVRSWWKYACKVITNQQKKARGHFSWSQIMRYTKLRKRYLSIYVNCLRSNPSLLCIDDNKEIQELDRELDVDVIIQWRMLAHMVVGYHRSQDTDKRQKPRSWWWLSWGNKPDEDEPKSLTDEDWAQLNQLIGHQEGAQSAPFPGEGSSAMLHIVVEVRMRSNATKLLDNKGLELMQLSCDNLSSVLKLYQEMKILEVTLGSYRLSSFEGLLAESASDTDTLRATFTYKPVGKNIDWSLFAKASPCYVTYLKGSIDRVIDFFVDPNAVSQTIALETAAAFQATLDEVARSAQQQLNEALKNRPRFILDLDIAAPKIIIPSDFQPDGVHNTKLLLDMGYLTLRTEDESLSETEEEIDIYMRFRFGLSELEAFLVDGNFDWKEHYNTAKNPNRSQFSSGIFFLPLLEKCRMIAALQQICIPHPSYPSTRLSVWLPSLGFHFSPARYHRLIQIMKLFQGSSSDDAGKAICPWYPADFEGEASMLTWKGIGNRDAVWQHRYLALAGPFVYILDNPSSTSYRLCSSLIGKQVVVVSPELIGGTEHVLAVCDAGQFDSKVVKCVNALVLRFGSEDERANWQDRLQGAIYRYSAPAAVAGIVELQQTGNGSNGTDALTVGEGSQFNIARKESFFLIGALDELKLVLSCKKDEHSYNSDMLLASESPLLEIRALGSKVELVMRKYDTSIGAVLQALEVEDMVCDKASAVCHYFARSDITVTRDMSKKSREKRICIDGKDFHAKSGTKSSRMSMSKKEMSEMFFDSSEDLPESDNTDLDPGTECLTTSMSDFQDAKDFQSDDSLSLTQPPRFRHTPGLLPNLEEEGGNTKHINGFEHFVTAQIILFSQESPGYMNIDNQVMISLATLSFFCNRPTILALLDLFTSLSMELGSEQHPSLDDDEFATNLDPEAVKGNKDDLRKKGVFERKESALKGLLGRGKTRTIFFLILNMDRALFVLNREDGAQLATLSQEGLHAEIKVFPSSFGVKAALGNLKIIDDSLYEGHDYYYICDMRNPGGMSFVELELLSFNEDDSDYQDFEYSISGKLSEVRLIYLNRFIQEIFSYFMGLVPQDSGYVVKLKDRVTNVEKFFTQSEIEGTPGLKLDISLTKPIIIMPRTTNSKDFLELDILRISVRNNLQWIGGNKDDLGAIRMDTITLQVEDVRMAVGVDGKAGEGIIQKAEGFLLVLRRPLRDIWHQVPAADACIKIRELKAALSDREYKVITDCALSNISEMPNLPAPIFDHNSRSEKHSINMEGEKESALENTTINGKSGAAELPWTIVEVSVMMDLVELALFSGRSRDASLATLQLSGIWFAFRSNSSGESFIMATLDSFSIRDDREGTQTELRYLIGKGDLYSPLFSDGHGYPTKELGSRFCEDTPCSSPIMLVVDVKLSQTLQMVSLRIQQPRLLVVIDFLLAIAEFFVPSLMGIVSDDKGTEENFLKIKDGIFLSQPYYQHNLRAIRLTPNSPLIADNEHIDYYVYDGVGGCILLLNRNGRYIDGSSSDPLVFIGNNKHLQFKNVVIQNGQYLDSCVFLGTNSSYTASENDGVFLEECPSCTPDESSEHVPSFSGSNFERKQHQKTDNPATRTMVDLQAISPELIFCASGRNSLRSWQSSERLLRARMDIFSRLVSEGDDIELNANINGLMIEAGNGFNVLQPVDTKLKYSMVSGRQNIHVMLSDILTKFSFGILQVIISLQEDILSFLRITAKQATVECSEFDRIWTDNRNTEMEHVTIWRPRAPSGFAILGHCMTPLDEPPLQAILALNLSYTHVKRPLSFHRVWSSNYLQWSEKYIKENDGCSKRVPPSECSIWFPVAPPGYVAFGCVASAGEEPPPLSSAVCVLEQLATSTGMKDCIRLKDCVKDGVTADITFWRVDNSAGSFFVLPSLNSLKVKALELRYITICQRSASDRQIINAQSTREDAQNMVQEHSFVQDGPGVSRSELTCSENVTCFELVWWDKNNISRRNISIWRPILPSECAFLGDIAVDGYEPPSSALVLRNPYDGVLLKRPLSFEKRGHIRKRKDLQSVSFWFPVAPPGYTALGCVASLNAKINPELYDSLCCVRNDLVTRAQFLDRLCHSAELRHCDEVFSIWPVENKAHTFVVRHGSNRPPKRLALRLADYEKTPEPDDLVIDAEVSKLTAILHDDSGGFIFPLLKLSSSGINLSMHGTMNGMSSTANFTLEMLTYNGKLGAWESFVESTNGFIRYENMKDSLTLPNTARSQIRIVSTSNLNANLSAANINMFLEAYSSWRELSIMEDTGKQAESNQHAKCRISAIDIKHKNPIPVVHWNRLGQDVILRTVDPSGQLINFPLSAEEFVSIELPSPSSMMVDPNLNKKSVIQSITLAALKIGDAHLKYEGGLGGLQFVVAVRILPQVSLADKCCLQEQSARTRGMNPLSNLLPGEIIVQWNEVFIFEVVPGETCIAEMVVIDLTKGSSVGYCSVVLTGGETRNGNLQSIDHQPIYGTEMEWQCLLQPEGPGNDEQSQQKYHGQISYASCFFSVMQACDTNGALMWDKFNPKPGTIQISYPGQDSWVDVCLDFTAGVTWRSLDTDTIITEISTEHRQKHVIMRSSVMVINATDVPLDVTLCRKASSLESGGSAIEVANGNPLEALSVVDEIFENERYQPLAGWGSSWPGHLLPSDPDHWSKRDGSCSTKDFPDPGLPLGWQWMDNWHVDKTGAADEGGWSYLFDFRTTNWPPKENSKGPFTFVRRRRWIRSRQPINTDGSKDLNVGILEPGANLPLPIACLRPKSLEYYLCIRPHEDYVTQINYEWSCLVTSKSKSETSKIYQSSSQVGIHSLVETQLLLCCMKHQESSSYNKSCVWFCLDINAKDVRKNTSLTPLKDWKIRVLAPLTLSNLLPVSSEYTVLEKCPTLGLIVRDRGILAPKKEAQILHADITRPLYLTWLPQGGWQPEHDAVLISHPNRQLASYVTLESFHTRRRLHVLIDYGQDRKDVIAKKIRLYAPCWLDIRDCPPLNYQFLEVKKETVKMSDSKLNYKSPTIKPSKLAKIHEQINSEEINDSMTMVSVFDIEDMGLSVSLSASPNPVFGPVVPLSLLMDMEGITELRAIDEESSTYYKLALSLRLCPYQSVPTKVIVIRPYMIFVNRLGQCIYLKQNSADHSKALQPSDYRMAFPISMADDQERLQVRTDETTWSFPISIQQEESTHIVMRQENGTRNLIRMEVRGNEEGSKFVVFFRHASVHGPYRFENHTKQKVIEFRQAGCDDDSWQSLQSHSTKRFAWDDPHGMQLLEVKIGSIDVSACEKHDINKVGDHICCNDGTRPAMCIHVEEINVLKIVKFLDIYLPDEQESPEGNCSSISNFKSVIPVEVSGPQVVPLTSHLEAILDIGQVGLSVIDPKPQELVYLYMEKVYVAYSTGSAGNTSRFKLVIGYCQLDNQLQFTCMPVLLAPEDKRMLTQPVIKLTATMAEEKSESIEVYPYIGIQVSQCPWRINVHEPIIWAAMHFYNSLQFEHLSGGSDTVQVDPEVRIDLIDVSETRLKLSLATDPRQRPHGILGIWNLVVTTLGNIHKMPIHVRSFSRRQQYMRKSTLFTAILGHLKKDLFHNPLLLLTGVDVIGMASSTFASLSDSVAELSGDGKYLQLRSRQDRSRRIAGVRDGLLQGTEALAQGVAFGVSGVVTKPVTLAKQHGVVGFLQGLGKAVLGFVVQPVSGAFGFIALTVNGVGASCSRCFEVFQQEPKFERMRPALAIQSDGIIRPYNRKAAMGQAILQLAEARHFPYGNVFKELSKFAWSDFYEDHFDVPGNKVVMITSKRVMLLQCPVSNISNKILEEPCSVLWEVPWKNLLALEVAGGTNDSSPRYLVLHIRDLPNAFAYTVKCFVDDSDVSLSQAKLIKSGVQKAWKTHCPENGLTVSRMSKSHQRRTAPGSTSRRGIVLGKDIADNRSSCRNPCGPSTRENAGYKEEIFLFEEIWTSKQDENAYFSFCIHEASASVKGLITIWRPLVPDGYVSVGDIARVGMHPPMFTDAYKNEDQRFAPPTCFDLVWRNWRDGFVEPISIWMPRAPDGYVALGCVAIASYAEPQAGCVWCVRADLVEETEVEQEIWHAPNQSPWGCFIYQVSSQALTFIATRRPLQHGKAKRIALHHNS